MPEYKRFNVQQQEDVTVVQLAETNPTGQLVANEFRDELIQLVETEKPRKLLVNFGAAERYPTAAISGLLPPEIREQIVGLAEVKEVFRSPKLGDIAGCIVTEGFVKRHNPIRVLRENVVIYEGELESLRRFKDDVNEVKSGTECGIGVKNYDNVQVGDQIECYERVEVARTLD